MLVSTDYINEGTLLNLSEHDLKRTYEKTHQGLQPIMEKHLKEQGFNPKGFINQETKHLLQLTGLDDVPLFDCVSFLASGFHSTPENSNSVHFSRQVRDSFNYLVASLSLPSLLKHYSLSVELLDKLITVKQDKEYPINSPYSDVFDLGFIAYDEFDDYLFIHHNQLSGQTRNINSVWDKFHLRSLLHYMTQHRKPIIYPDRKVYRLLHQRVMVDKYNYPHQIPLFPYQKHITRVNRFKLMRYAELIDLFPSFDRDLVLCDYLSKDEIQMWVKQP